MGSEHRLTLKAQLDQKNVRYPLDVTTPELEALVLAIVKPTSRAPKPE